MLSRQNGLTESEVAALGGMTKTYLMKVGGADTNENESIMSSLLVTQLEFGRRTTMQHPHGE